jgi:hypothetical protein
LIACPMNGVSSRKPRFARLSGDHAAAEDDGRSRPITKVSAYWTPDSHPDRRRRLRRHRGRMPSGVTRREKGPSGGQVIAFMESLV